MDIVRNIFLSPTNTRKDSSFTIDSPLGALEEQIKLLENINLSPLPTSKESVMNHRNEVSAILKKIIYNIDIILMEKLKKNKSEIKNTSALSDSDSHYWTYLSKYFQIPSVKFINNIYDKLQTNSEKGLAWIYISISEKSFHEAIKEIYNQNFDKKFYESDSLLNKNKSEILFFSEKISKFHLFQIKLGIEDEYNEYKRQKEIESKDNDRSDFELPIMPSPIRGPHTRTDNLYSINTPTNLELKETQRYNQNYYSKATLDLNVSIQSRSDINDKMNLKMMDNLFNIINVEDEENLLNNVDQPDEEDLEIIREKSYAKNTQIIYYNVNKENSNVNFNNYNGDEKVLGALKNMTKQQNIENFNVSKYLDFQHCYKEDFYQTIFDNKNQLGGVTNSNNNTTNYNTNNKVNLSPPKKQINLVNTINTLNTKKSNELNLDNLTYNNFIPFDKNFRISRKVGKNQFTKKDIIYYNNKEVKMTNSIVFYLNHFYKKEPYIKFNTQITTEKPMTLAAQNHQCQFCLKKFKTFMHIPINKVFWCSYFMRYICQDCVSDEFSIIPAFVLKHWDFRKFQISKQAKELLNEWYNKPVIHIKQKDPIIKQSSLLHSACVIKRKIHKVFDLMKCDKSENFVLEILGNYKHFVLRENLFSLKDFVDIHEYKLINKLKEFYQKFEDHLIKDCSICNYKGGNCMMCMNEEIIFAYDVESVLYCNECKKLFHKKCCSFHPCIINR